MCMHKSAADFVLLIRDDLCEALVSPTHLAKIASLSKGLPPLSLMSIECRLSAENGDVDFALCVYERKGFEMLAAFISENNLANSPKSINHKSWHAIASFTVHWLTRKQPVGALKKINDAFERMGHRPVAALPAISADVQ